jgi:hypothetical protein
MEAKDVFTFPNPVNEVSARVVAAGVVTLATATVASRRRWLIVPLAYGFVARAVSGPTLSPLGQLATRVITPHLPVPPKPTPGPPKRFAQTIGAVISLTALVLAFGFRRTKAAYALVAMIGVFATLESGFGFCVGCKIFGILMRFGLIPDDVCAECANIWSRSQISASAPASE